MARSLYFICILYFFCMLLSFHWKVLCFFSCVKFTCFYWSSNTYSIVYRLNWMCCFTEEFCLQNEGEGNSGGPRTDGLQGWIFQRVHQIFTSDLLEDCFNGTGEGQHQSDAWPHAKVLLSSILRGSSQMCRVDHAGEFGADRIYAGQMAVLGDTEVSLWLYLLEIIVLF